MRWTVDGYHRMIYTEYGLALVGWPDDIPFADLSKPGVTGLLRISRLLEAWRTRTLRFVPVLLDKAARAAKDPMDVVPSAKHRGGMLPGLGGGADLKKQHLQDAADVAGPPAPCAQSGSKAAARRRCAAAAAKARAERGVSRGEDPDDPIELYTDDETAAERHAARKRLRVVVP